MSKAVLGFIVGMLATLLAHFISVEDQIAIWVPLLFVLLLWFFGAVIGYVLGNFLGWMGYHLWWKHPR